MNKKVILLCVLLILIVGCYGATGIDGIQSGHPIKQGCGYIAAAIVTHAVIQAIFNK